MTFRSIEDVPLEKVKSDLDHSTKLLDRLHELEAELLELRKSLLLVYEYKLKTNHLRGHNKNT